MFDIFFFFFSYAFQITSFFLKWHDGETTWYLPGHITFRKYHLIPRFFSLTRILNSFPFALRFSSIFFLNLFFLFPRVFVLYFNSTPQELLVYFFSTGCLSTSLSSFPFFLSIPFAWIFSFIFPSLSLSLSLPTCTCLLSISCMHLYCLFTLSSPLPVTSPSSTNLYIYIFPFTTHTSITLPSSPFIPPSLPPASPFLCQTERLPYPNVHPRSFFVPFTSCLSQLPLRWNRKRALSMCVLKIILFFSL